MSPLPLWLTAIDLTYGAVLCFSCHDYVYCDEVDTIVQSQRQLAGTSLGKFCGCVNIWATLLLLLLSTKMIKVA